MNNFSTRLRLVVMLFLEFGAWGAYLTSMGSYLAAVGLGTKIGLFFAMQGIVSIFMPTLIGIVADRFIPAQKVLSLCHAIAGVFMLGAGLYCSSVPEPSFGILFTLYSISVAFYMPTVGLGNSVSYKALEKAGMDPVTDYPPVRIFGTVGFLCAMLFVNFMRDGNGVQFQNSYMQFCVSGVMSLVMCVYALTMPNCPVSKGVKGQSLADAFGLKAFSLFKRREMALFFVFSMLLGAALQITNGYANPFITSFKDNPAYAATWGANNANALISISQLSETICILLIPFFMKRFGIKGVMGISMLAWVLRFGLFGVGNPGSGVWMFVLSCIVYGVAFDFFNISGSLFVNQKTDKDIQSSAQGLFMLMSNGLGATIGTLAAGVVVNHFVYNAAEPSWSNAWLVFAAYALVLLVLFMVIFPSDKKQGAAK